MDEKRLMALLRQAKHLPNDEARQKWLDSLSAEERDAVLKKAREYAEAAFEAASDHLWAANNIFEPLSHGEDPTPPLPTVKVPPKRPHQP